MPTLQSASSAAKLNEYFIRYVPVASTVRVLPAYEQFAELIVELKVPTVVHTVPTVVAVEPLAIYIKAYSWATRDENIRQNRINNPK
jgi:hypothetical protein